MDSAVEYADLTDRTVFPPVNELLGLNPNEHICFLGQIVSVENFTRLVLRTTDIDGENAAVAFYTPNEGTELPSSTIRPGYTVAILEAKPHTFLDGSVGVRVEDPAVVRVFPLSVKALQDLSSKLYKYATSQPGENTCHGCDKKGPGMLKCVACGWFWYCDRSCQQVGWTENGHKADCKGLKDPDLKGLYLAKWEEESRQRFKFPLNSTGGA